MILKTTAAGSFGSLLVDARQFVKWISVSMPKVSTSTLKYRLVLSDIVPLTGVVNSALVNIRIRKMKSPLPVG